MTNWNKLAPEAKNVLFGASKYSRNRRALDRFANVVGDFEEMESIANKSKTGSVLMAFSLFTQTLGTMAGGFGGFVASTSSVTAGPIVTAKLMTNPKFVQWMSNAVEIAKTKPNAMSAHIGRLFMLREQENIKEEINQVINYMTSIDLKGATQ